MVLQTLNTVIKMKSRFEEIFGDLDQEYKDHLYKVLTSITKNINKVNNNYLSRMPEPQK